VIDIYISSLSEARKINHHFDSVLSVLHEDHLGFTHKDHLHVSVDDITRPWSECLVPSVDHARTIVEWATPRVADDHRILIHCHAGMSRSTASALALCVISGMTEDEAWEHAFASRPDPRREFIPNPLLLSHFDKILGSDLLSGSDRKWELNRRLGWATR
jgi:predicted protein tyrosine phosphatase